MKKNLLLILICCLTLLTLAQPTIRDFRNVRVRSCVDTTNIQFKEIYNFWENYQDDLCKNQFQNANIDLNKYWYDTEIINYKKPDIIFERRVFYYMLPEFIIGIEMRNDTLFEIKSLYNAEFNNPNSEINLILSVYVIKKNGNYFLYNKFSENKKKLKEYSKYWFHIHYPDNYEFNENKAHKLFERANKFLNDFGLKNTEPVHYYLCPNYTELSNLIGIDMFPSDFSSISNINTAGWSQSQIRLIFYTQGGESKLHEFIHVFIHDLRNNNDSRDYQFDEGVCCYFGDHVGLQYDFHVKRLKTFLNNNPDIDLSIDLSQGFLSDNNKSFFSRIITEENALETVNFNDDSTSFSYIIMGTICEIAMQKGGFELVKQMILKTPNDEKFYDVIEKSLGIKREEVNIYIRDFLNKNY